MIETEGLTGADALLRVLSHMGVDRHFFFAGLGVVAGMGGFCQSKGAKRRRAAVYQLAP